MTNTDDDTVLVTHPGQTIEQRKVRIRYGGRSLFSLVLIIAGVVCASWDFGPRHYEYAYIAALAAMITNAGIALRYQRDLKWITGHDKNSGNA